MKKEMLLICFVTIYGLIGCDNRADLNPKVSHFNQAKHLKKFDGSEGLSEKLSEYIFKIQTQRRKVASTTNSSPLFSPEARPKFPLSYFLIPEEMAQFLSTETTDPRVLDQLLLKISGKKHSKFFVHPMHEREFEFLRGAYAYVGADRTEFYATPTTDENTLAVWNRNNPQRKVFIIVLENSEQEGKLNRQIIRDLPINVLDEKN